MFIMNKEDADKLKNESNAALAESRAIQRNGEKLIQRNGEKPIQKDEEKPYSDYYCSECMRRVKGKKTIFGRLKCEYCKAKLSV